MRTAFIPSWLDDLKLDVYEFRFYCHVLRRGELYASVESICQTCGFDRKKLFQTIVSLEAKNLLSVTREKGKTNRIKALQPVPKTEHLPVPKTEQEVCRIRNTKDTPLKESPIKEALPLIPMAFPFDSPEFKQTWQMWEEERKKRKKPLSETAIKIQIKRMIGFTEKEIINALEEAMDKRWATIYPKKDKATNQPRSTAQPTKPRSIYD
jgi:sugar-specific transcriptional regulator TrmB